MEINQTKQVKVNAKVMKIFVKCSDRFTYSIEDQDGTEIFTQDDGYVPDFMPGEHYGDYIILDIDIDTGTVLNWKTPTAEQLEKAMKEED